MIELLTGRWQDVLVPRFPEAMPSVDAIITDPPYSQRVKTGSRGGSSVAASRITYNSIGRKEVNEFVDFWVPRTREWLVVWVDHVMFPVWEQEVKAHDWRTFAPVGWVRTNAAPRMAGDGPTCSVEYLFVARSPGWPKVRGSRPGHYLVPRADKLAPVALQKLIGRKPLEIVQQVVDAYAEPGDLVVDPYAGSATTLRACVGGKQSALGAEMDPVVAAAARSLLPAGDNA
jgi:site-specific DNA-methyltransferase (adenine-specific)